jgi:hypothetical protein
LWVNSFRFFFTEPLDFCIRNFSPKALIDNRLRKIMAITPGKRPSGRTTGTAVRCLETRTLGDF